MLAGLGALKANLRICTKALSKARASIKGFNFSLFKKSQIKDNRNKYVALSKHIEISEKLVKQRMSCVIY